MLFPLDLWLDEDPAPVWLPPDVPKDSMAWWRIVSAEILKRRKP